MKLLPSIPTQKRTMLIGACSLLAIITGILYTPITGDGFINFDDHQYIVNNPHVNPGLTWSGLAWAFQSGYAANWHPLTWMSHMLDCELYGLNPGGHHFTNLLFHVANTVLVFLVLNAMTGGFWRSLFVAAFFGWHPLHVESVAWASERKDVLSTFFLLLTLAAYLRYAEKVDARLRTAEAAGAGSEVGRRRAARGTGPAGILVFRLMLLPFSLGSYWLVLVLFVLGLMSKPMLVTLPFCLLLLDFWPLGRFRPHIGNAAGLNSGDPGGASCAGRLRPDAGTVLRLVSEKTPLFVLSMAACFVTYEAQKVGGAFWAAGQMPLHMRVANAVVSYVRYVGKAFWPSDLALIYPYRQHWPVGLVAGAVLLLALITCVCLLLARRRPYLIMGWLWFLGTLVPVIGLVQVGDQSMADRYMYIPSIGLFILVVWGLNDLMSGWGWLARGRVILGIAALAGCLVLTTVQVKYWRNSKRIFEHTLQVTTDNYKACCALGRSEEDLGRKDLALELYERAVRIEPRYAQAQYDLGTALMDKGRLDEAISHLVMAVKDDPNLADAHYNLAKAWLNKGKLDEAAGQFSKASELRPRDAEMRYSLGTLLLRQSKIPAAVVQLAEAVRLRPNYSEAQENLGIALMSEGRVGEAIGHFFEVVRREPGNLKARLDLGLALLENNQPAAAESQFGEALRLKPDDPQIEYQLATALIQQHKSKEAIRHYRAALRLRPAYPEALNGLAWVLVSDSKAGSGGAQESLRLAEEACQQTRFKDPTFIVTLAAAYAQNGQFPDAIASARKARELAEAADQKAAAFRAGQLLKLFVSGRTVRDALK